VIESCKLPFRFDARALREDLATLPEDSWIPHYNRQDYAGSWTVVALRSLQGRPGDAYAGALPPEQYQNTELLERCPHLLEAISGLPCPKTTVRLMRLAAGSRIKPHRDSAMGYEDGRARLHIPVRTHPQVDFRLRDRRVDMHEGECWYLNLNLPHRVFNASPVDRVHLVLDCIVDDWLGSVFTSLGFGEAEALGPGTAQRPLTREEARQVIALLRLLDTPASHQLIRELTAAQAGSSQS
jgi:hypothetical protein